MTDLATVAEAVDALTNPINHVERIFDKDKHRHRRLRRVWTTTHPSLLDQLAAAVQPGEVYVEDRDVYGGRATPRSTPPARLEAINSLLQIDAGAGLWTIHLRLPQRETTAANLRAFVGARLDSDQAVQLLRDLRRWYGWAATLTDWERPPWAPQVPCPLCGVLHLRVRPERKTATCLECGEAWTEDTIGLLARHIVSFADAAEDRTEYNERLRTLAVLARRAEDERYRGALRQPALPTGDPGYPYLTDHIGA